MKKLTIQMCLISNLLIAMSCQSTAIYFDLDSQSIVSCNNRPLRRLIVECDSLNGKYNDCSFDLFVNKSIKVGSEINIYKLGEIYNVNPKDTIFYPNSCYKILFVGGADEGATGLKIWFDEHCKVYKTDKPECN